MSDAERWIELYEIDLQQVNRKAAETYLEGEADYGGLFDRRDTLEDRRTQFANAAINLCATPIEQVFLLLPTWSVQGWPVGTWTRHAPAQGCS